MSTRHSRGQDPLARSGAELTSATDELAQNIAAFWENAARSSRACYENWLRLVSAPFDAAMRRAVPSADDALGDGERRAAALPWVPKFDTQVVPFRRATDPPGAEGSRIMMRMAVPGVFGAGAYTNVFSLDTLVPRLPGGEENALSAPSEPAAGTAGQPAQRQRAAG